MAGTIYIIRNTVNNKVYVGQTVNLKERWAQHRTAAKHIENHNNNHSILYNAMRKYGIDNFYLEILEDEIPNEKLNEKEAYWIKKMNSVRPNGYNILPGITIGEQHKRAIYQLDINTYEIINSFSSLVEASKETGIYLTGIQRVLSKVLKTAGGYRWCYQENYEEYKKNIELKPYCRRVLQIDKKTNEIIKEWNSVSEAATALNITKGAIYKVLSGTNKTCKGFIWKYKTHTNDNVTINNE